MMTEPKLEQRAAQPYLAIRTRVPMPNWGHLLPPLWGAVFGLLGEQGVPPAGPPFIRYRIIDMATELEIEVGVPVPHPLPGSGNITPGEVPAGRYATLVYTGDYSGLMDATGALLAWAATHGVTWQTSTVNNEEVWGGRFEFYLTNPDEVPDPANWETELAFLTAGA